MQVQHVCFCEFPDQCSGCPEYRETRQDQTTQILLLAGMGYAYPTPTVKVVKECKVFHKRVVEYQR